VSQNTKNTFIYLFSFRKEERKGLAQTFLCMLDGFCSTELVTAYYGIMIFLSEMIYS